MRLATNRGRRTLAHVVVLGMALLAAACTGATFGSGVGDEMFEHSPYYAGKPATRGVARGHLPIAYQAGASHAPIFDPQPASPAVAALLEEMNAYLDSLGATVRVAAVPPRGATPPDVRFGCEQDASGECTDREAGVADGKPRMWLSVGRPSGEWAAWAGEAFEQAGVEAGLLLTLEVGQYWVRQKNLRGSKEIELGTRYAAQLPWLTSLDAPVSVVQLTGALVGADGRAIRIGAEGLLARRTNLVLSGFGAQALIRDEDIEQLRATRREDLPGQPLVWQAALRTLVAELTARPELVSR